MTRELIDEILESIGLESIEHDSGEHDARPGHAGIKKNLKDAQKSPAQDN